jgi:K+-transporting ATPase ATPase F chain
MNLNPVFTSRTTKYFHSFDSGVGHGYRFYFRCCRAVGPDGLAGLGFQKTRKTARSSLMSSLDIMYGIGGLCALLLLAYLVYALLRAEEF